MCISYFSYEMENRFCLIHVRKNLHHFCVLLNDVERNGGNSAINCNASATFNYNLI